MPLSGTQIGAAFGASLRAFWRTLLRDFGSQSSAFSDQVRDQLEVTTQGFDHLRCKHFRVIWSTPWRPLLAAEALRAQIAVNQALPGQTPLLSEALLWASPCAGRLEQPRTARAKRRGQPPRLRDGRKRNRSQRLSSTKIEAATRPCFWARNSARLTDGGKTK